MFSTRTPSDFAPNRLTSALEAFRREGRPYIDLTLSNPTRASFDYPSDLLEPLGDSRGLVYAPEPFGLPAAREAVAQSYAARGISIAAERIVLTASTSEAYAVLFKLLADAGDTVLVPRPSYPLFDHLTRLDLVTAKPYDLEYHGRWQMNVPAIAEAIDERTRAILVVSPNNPTGSYIKPEEREALTRLCAEHGLAIVADEVFADYELIDGASSWARSFAATNDALAFSLGGLSKSVGLPQLKLAWIAVSGPDEPVRAALERLELICDTYLSVSTPVQAALGDLLERGETIRAQIQRRVRANARQLQGVLATIPACCMLQSEGGWYSVIQVPTLEPEESLAVNLLEEDGVLIHPGYFFDFPRESFLIVSLLPPEATFRRGIDRIARRFERAGRAA